MLKEERFEHILKELKSARRVNAIDTLITDLASDDKLLDPYKFIEPEWKDLYDDLMKE
jgi:hypothetical protein